MKVLQSWHYGVTALVGWGLVGVAVASCRGKVESTPPTEPSSSASNTEDAGIPETLGETCVPADEYSTSFSGYDEDEVSVDVSNPACATDTVCLVNHFRGRVSCPYGQTQASIDNAAGDAPERCVVPNATGEDPADRIAAPVRPQLVDRQPEDAVYCTCRCADAEGNSAGDELCACPSGFSCEPVVDDLGSGSRIAGSYCIKDDTIWDATTPPGPGCSSISSGCGDPRPELDVPPPSGEATTTNQFVERIVQTAVNEIDLLIMIDNSISMADKQNLFRQAIPEMFNRLIDPLCAGANGELLPKVVGGTCPSGTSEEFNPIADIHLAVVSSSLGGHGGVLCSPALGESFNPMQDDRGELIAPLRGVASYQGLGFLKWDAQSQYSPPGLSDQSEFVASATDLVAAAGEQGCGYEAGLEAWYRFLIDPQPPVDVVSDGTYSRVGSVNTTVLEQRAAFLRPDSLVAIVMLSDENDCSIRDDGVSWLIGDQTKRIPRGTSACRSNPNDPCCRSCALAEASPPSGCDSLSSDPECVSGAYAPTDESLNLRCFEQKRRFGIDFLYPWSRYVEGLRLPTVLGRDCAQDSDCPANHPTQKTGTCLSLGSVKKCEYVNPLNALNPNYPERVPRTDSSRVFLAGVVGVPWQDIATDQSLQDPDVLDYLSTTQDPDDPDAPTLSDRWDVILGEPDANILPLDPFMIESIDPRDRMSSNPVTGEVPSPVTAPGGASPINGHEYTIPARDDLQYACIFPLGATRDCATASGGCDCKNVDSAPDRPLCQAPGSTSVGTTQYFAKAYPGLRYLKVLQEYGTNSIVASVCPKITDPSRASELDYGYNPVARALLERIGQKAHASCLPRALPTNADGSLACQVIEATNPQFGVTCATLGRTPLDGPVAEVARRELAAAGRCGDAAGQIECDAVTLCALTPATDPGACLDAPDEVLGDGPLAGYCYIDAMQDLDGDRIGSCINAGDPDCIGNPELVANCDPSQRRILRIVSRGVTPEVPFGTATLLVACESSTLP